MATNKADINFEAPVKSVSIENMVRQRAAMVERVERARALLKEASEIAEAGHLGMPRINIEGSTRRDYCHPLLAEGALEAFVREIDRGAWEHLMKESGLMTFMDATARREWTAQLYEGKDLPEFTQENVEATFRTLYASRGEMFERGVIRCFRGLSWDYKTNQPFCFGKRIIINGLFSYSRGSDGHISFLSHNRTNELDDLMRVFHLLDGKPEPDHRQGMYYQLSDAARHGNEWENEYVHVRWFKKGSGHVTFKRPDLVERMNEIVARHYPGALPDGRRGPDSRWP